MNLETLRLIHRLGYRNVGRVAAHRLKVRSGWYSRRYAVRPASVDGAADGLPFPAPVLRPTGLDAGALAALKREADAVLEGRVGLFGHAPVRVGSPPDWFRSVLTGREVRDPASHWSAIGDFTSGAGDIKGVWELSRFAWAVVLARAARELGDERYVGALNAWVTDWSTRNPPNQGPNWKCGQETALRMLHLLLAARILGRHRTPSPALVRFVTDHCRRIEATLGYALAQDNNHGISESAGLYVGGAWLSTVSAAGRAAGRWERKGRRHLGDLVRRLIAPDGSFSQHSTNYHRMVVDTLSEVETWREELGRAEFPEAYLRRCRRAVRWLEAFVDPVSGDAPNVGFNDGARLFAQTTTPFRDFRPSLATALARFPGGIGVKRSRVFGAGGYVRLAEPGGGSGWAMIRFPRYDFRPGDSDALHLDLWHGGRNLLRDAGTFTYNAEDATSLHASLSGPLGHNTVQFDGRDPMPRIGPFLRAHWLRAAHVGSIEEDARGVRWTGRYVDREGAEHERTVTAREGAWEVVDRVRGFRKLAVLRWRLSPGDWRLDGSLCHGPLGTISVRTSAGFTRVELTEGWEARLYGERTPIPVLEAEVARRDGWTEITTLIEVADRPGRRTKGA